MTNFYKILFFNLLIFSTLITISSISWLSAWIGLEMNLLALMPLMKNIKNKYSAEASIKYFITQAMASSLLLFSIIIFFWLKNFNPFITMFSCVFLNSALLLKLGMAPFHFWLPEVISGLNWNMIIMLLTWQKIGPMILLSYCLYSPQFLSIIIIISSFISSMQGMNQICLRKIMAYSSINHMSWMISTLMSSFNIWMIYFLIYSLINFNILIIFHTYKIYFLNQLSKLFSMNSHLKFFFMFNLLSLGGLPPFLGFFPKWMTINTLITNKFYIMSFILITSTLISLFFYLRITFSSFLLNNEKSLILSFKGSLYLFFYLNFLSLTGLMLILFFK
uniref:NADH-ubiquinone oxidoreductase chain 2 n=1 Tax=Curculionidae sp. 1 AH-2016 TaxID=1903827 RepID=A0A343C2L7_9CUCU|nr:NADH dehydrogenase subunit 2 [Curculionidae sp. 1 AH-2016]